MTAARKPLTRRERIELLLEWWPEFWETASRDDGPSGDGGVYLLPGMSRHPSVVELTRALNALRTYAPSKASHLFAFYAAPFRTVDYQRRAKGKNGRYAYVPDRRRERVTPSWVRTQKVKDGVSLIAQEPTCPEQAERRPWQYRGEPFIPQPLLQVA